VIRLDPAVIEQLLDGDPDRGPTAPDPDDEIRAKVALQYTDPEFERVLQQLLGADVLFVGHA